MKSYFKLDYLCKSNVIVECKAVDQIANEHRMQLWNYLKISEYPIGILVNFSPKKLEIERYYYNKETKYVSAF